MGTDFISPEGMTDLFPGTTVQSWASRRYKGTGPRFIKLGKSVFYRRADVEAWIGRNVYDRTDTRAAI